MSRVISAKPTGRDWGDKKPFAIIRTFVTPGGIKGVEYEFDAWEGSVSADERGQYVRHRHTDVAGYWMDVKRVADVYRADVVDDGEPGKAVFVQRKRQSHTSPTLAALETAICKALGI